MRARIASQTVGLFALVALCLPGATARGSDSDWEEFRSLAAAIDRRGDELDAAFDLESRAAAKPWVFRRGQFSKRGSRWSCRYEVFDSPHAAPTDRYVLSYGSLSFDMQRKGEAWSGVCREEESWDITFTPVSFGYSLMGVPIGTALDGAEDVSIARSDREWNVSFTTDLWGLPRTVRMVAVFEPHPTITSCEVEDQRTLQRYDVKEFDDQGWVRIASHLVRQTGHPATTMTYRKTSPELTVDLWRNPVTDFKGDLVFEAVTAATPIGFESRMGFTAAMLERCRQAVLGNGSGVGRLSDSDSTDKYYQFGCGVTASWLYLLDKGHELSIFDVAQGVRCTADGLMQIEDVVGCISKSGAVIPVREFDWEDLRALTGSAIVVYELSSGSRHATFIRGGGERVSFFDPVNGVYSLGADTPPPPDDWRCWVIGGGDPRPISWHWRAAAGLALLSLVSLFAAWRLRVREIGGRLAAAAALLMAVGTAGCGQQETRLVCTSGPAPRMRYEVIASAITAENWWVEKITRSCSCVRFEEGSRGNANRNSVSEQIVAFEVPFGAPRQVVGVYWRHRTRTEDTHIEFIEVPGTVEPAVALRPAARAILVDHETRRVRVHVTGKAPQPPRLQLERIEGEWFEARLTRPRQAFPRSPEWITDLVVSARERTGPTADERAPEPALITIKLLGDGDDERVVEQQAIMVEHQ